MRKGRDVYNIIYYNSNVADCIRDDVTERSRFVIRPHPTPHPLRWFGSSNTG